MDSQVSRRMIVGSAVALAVNGVSGSASMTLARDVTEQSAGLGLSEVEIEGIYGPGSPGQSFMVYTHPTYGVDLHVGYDGDVVDYIYMALGDGQSFTGLPLDDAWNLAGLLLPPDAKLHETYASQETPGSIAQLETMRYTSRWLDEVLGRSSILVTINSVPAGSGMEAIRGMIQVGR